MVGAIQLSVADGVATLTLDNPSKLNAMDSAMWQAMPLLLARVQDDTAARVLVLRGAGERAFCTGNDIAEFETLRADAAQAERYNAYQHEVEHRLRALTKPAIAVIHGFCLGAGLEFALQCDFRLCSAAAQFGVPAMKLGLPYRHPDIAKLLDVLAPPVARELILLARRYPGPDALALGLVHRCLPDRTALEAEAAQWAGEIAGLAPLSLAAAKVTFRELLRRDGPPDLAHCNARDQACYDSGDFREGRSAFRDKRKPRFSGQ